MTNNGFNITLNYNIYFFKDFKDIPTTLNISKLLVCFSIKRILLSPVFFLRMK